MNWDTQAVKTCGSVGCDDHAVVISPSAGNQVQFPAVAAINAVYPGDTIYYRADGLDPMDGGATLYTVPFDVEDETVVVKARALTNDGCWGPLAVAQYSQLDDGDNEILFEHICNYDNEDHAGSWGVFEAGSWNGIAADYHLRLTFLMSTPKVVKRVEIYEADSAGEWRTGQAWSTDSPIYPEEMGGVPLSVFPAVSFVDGVQLKSDYDPLLMLALTGVLDLWCQPAKAPQSGYFKAVVVFDDDTTWTGVISHDCHADPSSSSSSSSSSSESSSSDSSSSDSSSSDSSSSDSSSSDSSSSTSSSSDSSSLSSDSSSSSSSSDSSSSDSSSSVSSSSVSSSSSSSSSSEACSDCGEAYLLIETLPDASCVTGTDNPGCTGQWGGKMQRSGTSGNYEDKSDPYNCIGTKLVNAVIWYWDGLGGHLCNELVITARPGDSSVYQKVWTGEKNGSQKGVYTRTSGCDTTPEITVSSYPT